MLGLLTRETTGVYQGALHNQASQRVADEDDRTVGAVSQLYEKFRLVLEAQEEDIKGKSNQKQKLRISTYISISGETGCKSLSMADNRITRSSIGEGSDIRIIAVSKNAGTK